MSKQKKCMRWYSLLFSVILGFRIPNSSNHCTCQRIFIMYSYICILFISACIRILSVIPSEWPVFPFHHQPAKGSSVMTLPSIIPRKSIVLPPLISLPMHADSPLHITSQTVDQPREEASCLCRWSGRSYREKASCHRCQSVRPRTLTCCCT